MQYRPDAAALLDAIADVLDDVLADVPQEKQHQVRVAAHLARLVEREVRLGETVADAERAALGELLGEPVTDVADGADRLAARLRDGSMLDTNPDTTLDDTAWQVLVETTRGDLDIAKPGHDRWEGT